MKNQKLYLSTLVLASALIGAVNGADYTITKAIQDTKAYIGNFIISSNGTPAGIERINLSGDGTISLKDSFGNSNIFLNGSNGEIRIKNTPTGQIYFQGNNDTNITSEGGMNFLMRAFNVQSSSNIDLYTDGGNVNIHGDDTINLNSPSGTYIDGGLSVNNNGATINGGILSNGKLDIKGAGNGITVENGNMELKSNGGIYKINGKNAVQINPNGSIGVGVFSGNLNAGQNTISIGEGALGTSNNSNTIAIGKNAGSGSANSTYMSNYGEGVGSNIFIGQNAGESNRTLTYTYYDPYDFRGDVTVNDHIFNSIFGYQAGYNSAITNSTALGSFAGYNASGRNGVYVGYYAGYNSTQPNNYSNSNEGKGIFIGENAGINSNSDRSILIGVKVGQNLNGNYNNFIGDYAGLNVNGDNNIGIGQNAGSYITNTNISNSISIGKNSKALTGGYGVMRVNDQRNYVFNPNGPQGNDDVINKQFFDNNQIFAKSGSNVGFPNTLSSVKPYNLYYNGNNLSYGQYAGVNVVGSDNLSFGNAGQNITGANNIGIGGGYGNRSDGYLSSYQVGSRINGWSNVAIGNDVGNDLNGDFNISIGNYSARFLTGSSNISYGLRNSLNLSGKNNLNLGTFVGNNIRGNKNISIGSDNYYTTASYLSGDDNISIGGGASNNLSGNKNATFGYFAGQNITGDYNTILGLKAGKNLSGYGNVAIGKSAGSRINGSVNYIFGDFTDSEYPSQYWFGDNGYDGSNLSGSYNVIIGRSKAGIIGDKNAVIIGGGGISGNYNYNFGGGMGIIGNYNLNFGGNGNIIGNSNQNFGGTINSTNGSYNKVFAGLLYNTSGDSNLAVAGTISNLTGSSNKIFGGYADKINGNNNYIFGDASNGFGDFAISGSDNYLAGKSALGKNLLGSSNYIAGIAAGQNVTGSNNLIVGGGNNTNGNNNTIINGQGAIGSYNYSLGGGSIKGSNNTVLNGGAVSGNNNFVNGYWGGFFSNGDNNIYFGNSAGSWNNGNNNIAIGDNAGFNYWAPITNVSNGIAIGKSAKALTGGYGVIRVNDQKDYVFNPNGPQNVDDVVTKGFVDQYAIVQKSGYNYGFSGALNNVINTALWWDTYKTNLAYGLGAGDNSKGIMNLSIGEVAGNYVTGNGNLAIGTQAGQYVNGPRNQAFGIQAGQYVNGNVNLALGLYAGQNVTGFANDALGSQAGKMVNGNYNQSWGNQAGRNITGNNNQTFGFGAGRNITGNDNISFGQSAGININGNDNLSIGQNAGYNIGVVNINNTISIGKNSNALTGGYGVIRVNDQRNYIFNPNGAQGPDDVLTKSTVNSNIGPVLHLSGNHYNVVSYNFNGTPTNGIKIKTNLPYSDGSQMPEITINGYNYGLQKNIGIKISYYIYNGNFINYSASSFGDWTPTIKLANEGGKVVIFLDSRDYFTRFGVDAYARGMGEQNSWFEGWSVADENISGGNIVTLPYNNTVGSLTTNGSLTANGNINTTNNIIANGLIKSNANGAPTFQGGDDTTINDVNVVNTLGIIGIQDSTRGQLQLGNNTNTFIHGVNGNIGIGTTGPGYKLDVNGNMRAASVIWGVNDSRTENRNDAGSNGLSGARSGYYETSTPTNNYPSIATGWWHMLDVRHSNSNNNYAMQFAGSFFDQNLYFRKTNNNASQAWSKIITEDPSGNTNLGNTYISGNVGIGTSPTASAKLDLNGIFRLHTRTDMGSNYFRVGTRNQISGIPHASGGHITQILWGDTNNSPESSTQSDGAWGLEFGVNGNPYLKFQGTDTIVGRNDGKVTINSNSVINGNLGVGISSPTSKLQINGGDIKLSDVDYQLPSIIKSYDNGQSLWIMGNGGNDSNSNSTELVLANAHNWDRGASIKYTPGTTAASAGELLIGQYQKNSSTATHGITKFFTNGIEQMRINPAGNVGIGTNSPSERLEVNGNIKANNVSVPSDIRYKKDINTLSGVLQKLDSIRGVSYFFKTDIFSTKNFDTKQQIGVIAQEIEKVFPQLVTTDPSGYKTVDYNKLSAVLLQAIKEQQIQIEQYKLRLETLEKKYESQQKQLDQIQKTLDSMKK